MKVITIQEGQKIPENAKYLGTTFEYVIDWDCIPQSGCNIPFESYPKKKVFYHSFLVKEDLKSCKEDKK